MVGDRRKQLCQRYSIRETTRDSLILLFDMYDHCELICCCCNDCHYVFEQDYKRLLIRK